MAEHSSISHPYPPVFYVFFIRFLLYVSLGYLFLTTNIIISILESVRRFDSVCVPIIERL